MHFVARYFCVKIKLPKEMPKMPKARPGATRLCILVLLMCHPRHNFYVKSNGDRSGPGLRYSIDFIRRKKQGMLLYSFTDFWYFMLKKSGVYNKDGAKRRHKAFLRAPVAWVR